MNEEKSVDEPRIIVVPGEIIKTGMNFIPSYGTYRDKENIRANLLGLVNIDKNIIRLIPLSGKYIPQSNDNVIGKVVDVLVSGWRIDINSPYTAVLPLKDASSSFIEKGEDLTKFYDIEDCVMTKITNVTSQKLVDVSMKGPGLRKLKGGRIISVDAHKVPRIIGKAGSMVSLVKQYTGCNIFVGQNGWVWIDGEPKNEVVAVTAIKKIEKESHSSGLTEKMKLFLEENSKNLVVNFKEEKSPEEDKFGGKRKQNGY